MANVHGGLCRPERAAPGTSELLDLSAESGPHSERLKEM